MNIEVYDNGGETFDRYTVIIGSSVFGMGGDPMMPNGFNQYSGELSELRSDLREASGRRLSDAEIPARVGEAIEARMGRHD